MFVHITPLANIIPALTDFAASIISYTPRSRPGPVVQKPINANPRLKFNQGVNI